MAGAMRTANAPREVHIGKVVRDALVFNFKNPLGGTVSDSALLDAVARLFTVLEERRIDYLLVGGIALLQIRQRIDRFGRFGRELA